MNPFEHVYATDVDHAVRLACANPGAVIVGGGSDLLAMMKEGLSVPNLLINLKKVPGLDAIEFNEGQGLRIGGMTSLRTLETNAILLDRFPALAEAAGLVASPQIRNVATVGGNIAQRSRCWYYRGPFNCWLKGGSECFAVDGENKFHAIFGGGPCYMVQASDLAPALVLFDATVVVVGPEGRRLIPAREFFVNPSALHRKENMLAEGEIVVEVKAPSPLRGMRTRFVKAMQRASWDAAIISIAIGLFEEQGVCRELRVVLGGVATTPVRASATEEFLKGKGLTAANITKAALLITSGMHPLSQNAYKGPLLDGYFRSVLGSLLEDPAGEL